MKNLEVMGSELNKVNSKYSENKITKWYTDRVNK